MKKRYFIDNDKLIIVDGHMIRELEEIKDEDKEEVEIPPPARKYTKKKVRLCKKCGEPGHRADGCPNMLSKDDDDESPKPKKKVDDSALADEITRLWANEGMSSLKVCTELNISLATMNRIVQDYEIVRI